jgi:hypothetical protein
VGRKKYEGRNTAIDRERQFLDQLLIGHYFIFTRRQWAIDALERERMLKRQRYPFRARDHGDVLEVAAQSLTRQETLATPSLTFDLNEHQARQSFRCAFS